MANILPMERQVLVANALAEGSSIRSLERITGIHRDTIMRLGVRIGEACTTLLEQSMRDLPCKTIQVDEIWGFVGCKKKNIPKELRRKNIRGDFWTFVAVDADTKAVPCFKVGKRSMENTEEFLDDLRVRMKNRIQLTSDSFVMYEEAVSYSFGNNVDYAQLIKVFSGQVDKGKYSPPQLIATEKEILVGKPNKKLISTSYVESQNLTMRMHCRRLTRLTNAFSKKLENFKAAIGLHFAYYNFVKMHSTIRATPAMALGISKHQWTMAELLERSASVK